MVLTQASLEPRRPGVGSIALGKKTALDYIVRLHRADRPCVHPVSRASPNCHARPSALCACVVPATAPVSLVHARVLCVRAARARALLLGTACAVRSSVRVYCVALAQCDCVLCARAVCARTVHYSAMRARGIGMSMHRGDRHDGDNASIARAQTARNWIDCLQTFTQSTSYRLPPGAQRPPSNTISLLPSHACNLLIVPAHAQLMLRPHLANFWREPFRVPFRKSLFSFRKSLFCPTAYFSMTLQKTKYRSQAIPRTSLGLPSSSHDFHPLHPPSFHVPL